MRLLGWHPAEGLLPRARGRADPGVATLVARGGTGSILGGNRGVRAPEASWRDRPIGVWLQHVAAPVPLGGSGPMEAIPKYLALMGSWGAPDLYELRGEVRRPRSQLPGPDCASRLPEDKGLENTVSTRVDSLSDDFLAG
jgi:hypothetical protein